MGKNREKNSEKIIVEEKICSQSFPAIKKRKKNCKKLAKFFFSIFPFFLRRKNLEFLIEKNRQIECKQT